MRKTEGKNDKSRLINYFLKYKEGLPKEILKYEQKYFHTHMNRLLFSAKLVDEVAKGRKLKILDVGVHGGYLAYLLKFRGHEVYGLDKERVETEFWKRRFNLEGIKFDTCDLTKEKLPYEDKQFDVVLFFEVIEHLPIHPIPVIQELKRVLKRGGLLLLSTPNFLSFGRRIRLVLGKSPYSLIPPFDAKRGTGHFREFTADELIFMMIRLGLNILKIEHRSFSTPKPPKNFSQKMLEIIRRFLTKKFQSLNSYIVLIAEKDD